VSLWQRALVARQIIGKQLNVLTLIDGRAAASGDFQRVRRRLQRWQSITAGKLTESISPEIGQEILNIWSDFAVVTDRDTLTQVCLVYQTFLYQLLEELKYSPENVLSP
jgi:hypothetical protein